MDPLFQKAIDRGRNEAKSQERNQGEEVKAKRRAWETAVEAEMPRATAWVRSILPNLIRHELARNPFCKRALIESLGSNYSPFDRHRLRPVKVEARYRAINQIDGLRCEARSRVVSYASDCLTPTELCDLFYVIWEEGPVKVSPDSDCVCGHSLPWPIFRIVDNSGSHFSHVCTCERRYIVRPDGVFQSGRQHNPLNDL